MKTMVVYIKRYPPSRRRRSDLPVVCFRIERGPILHRNTGRTIVDKSRNSNSNSNSNNSSNTIRSTAAGESSNDFGHNTNHHETICDPPTNTTATNHGMNSPNPNTVLNGNGNHHHHHHHHRPNTNTNTKNPYRNTPDDDLDDLQKLQKHCPESTLAERKRFLTAKKGDYDKAREQLTKYLLWRSQYGLDHDYHCCAALYYQQQQQQQQSSDDDDNDDDEEGREWHGCASDDQALDELDWKFASQKALLHDERYCRGGRPFPSLPAQLQLPQLARIVVPPTLFNSSSGSGGSHHQQHQQQHQQHHDDQHQPQHQPHARDTDGHRVLYLLPARMDLSVASEATFALSIALYLERKLGRDSPEKMAVFLDVRGGTGWANPSPKSLFPFVREVSACLEQNFPERLSRCVLFPLPAAATLLWKMVRVVLDPATAGKIAVVRGNAANTAAPPYDRMGEHVDRGVLERMEELRCASFG